MDFLTWLVQGIWKLWTLAVAGLAPVIQQLFAALGLPIDEGVARLLAALVWLIIIAWVTRRVFWGKPKMFEPQKIVLKTEKAPLAVVASDMTHWIGWGILLGVGLFVAIYVVSDGLW
jgi:hypothetical protein